MPFGGANFAGAGVQVPAANILPAGVYAAQVNGAPNPLVAGVGGPAWQKTRVEDRNSLNSMRIVQAGGLPTLDGPAANVVGAAVAPIVPVIAGAEVGVLATAVAVANQTGLPSNFGRGRGLWNAADTAHTMVNCREIVPVGGGPGTGTALAAARGPVANPDTVHVSTLLVVSDITIMIHNRGTSTGAAAAAGDLVSRPEVDLLWVPPMFR